METDGYKDYLDQVEERSQRQRNAWNFPEAAGPQFLGAHSIDTELTTPHYKASYAR